MRLKMILIPILRSLQLSIHCLQFGIQTWKKSWRQGTHDNQQNNKSISCCPFDTIGSMKSNGMFVSSDHDSLQCCRCWKTNWEFPWTTTKKRSETLTNSLNGKECWCMLLSLSIIHTAQKCYSKYVKWWGKL